MKKVIFIIVILVLLAGVVVGGYFLWQYYSKIAVEGGTTPTPPVGGLPPPVGGTPPGTTSSTTEESPLVAWGGPELAGYYIKNGTAIGLSVNGQVVSIRGKGMMPLNNSTFNEAILGIIPSSDGKWFLEKWGSGNSPHFSLFDTDSKAWTTFGDLSFVDMDFSPADPRIAYLELVNNKVNLGIMDLAKKANGGFVRTTLQALTLQDAKVTWASPDTIFLSEKPSARIPGSVWKYTISTKRLDPLILEQSGLWIKWDKVSGYGIGFYHNAQNRLAVIDSRGSTVLTPPFLTFPDKCAVSEDALYCAVPAPSSLSEKELPDAYLKRSFYTNDSIYKVSIMSQEFETLFTSHTPLDIRDLQIEGKKLYFINRYDQKLYQLTL